MTDMRPVWMEIAGDSLPAVRRMWSCHVRVDVAWSYQERNRHSLSSVTRHILRHDSQAARKLGNFADAASIGALQHHELYDKRLDKGAKLMEGSMQHRTPKQTCNRPVRAQTGATPARDLEEDQANVE